LVINTPSLATGIELQLIIVWEIVLPCLGNEKIKSLTRLSNYTVLKNEKRPEVWGVSPPQKEITSLSRKIRRYLLYYLVLLFDLPSAL